MKKIVKSVSVLLLSVVLMISAFPFCAGASPAQKINLFFSESEDGKAVLSLILPSPDRLTAIDFSVVLSSEISEIEALSTENTDVKDIVYDFDALPEDSAEENIFTYKTSEKSDRINFSGFFLDSLTTDKDFHLCDIIIFADGELSETDILQFSYTLTCEDGSTSESHTYSLLSRDLIENAKSPSYHSGDANLDGKVDASDARIILRASVGLDILSLEESPYADSDCDGRITATDARFALRLSVGLEEAELHSYRISLEQGKTCAEGGNYTFTCGITGKSFTMDIKNGGHIANAADCLNTGNCKICNEVILPAAGHKFDENGFCSECKADKKLIDEATEMLTPLLEEIHLYDTLAEESLLMNKYKDFISNTQEATKSIRKAADICDGIAGMEKVKENLMTAYSIRFQAFASLTDENGGILSSAGSCNVILKAVKESNQYIEPATA